MNGVFRAFFRAVASQLHPRMLALLIVPFVVAIAFWAVVAVAVWDPLVDFLRGVFFGPGGLLDWMRGWIAGAGLGGAEGVLVAVVALMLLVPLMFVTALLLIAIFSMPLVNRHLGERAYRDVARRGAWSVPASVWNALWSTALFVAGYLLTLPLWLIPPLGFVVPWLWWGWFTARVMRFDSLVEHADLDERRALIAEHRGRYLVLALLVTALNYIPPLFLITPVLSALAFGHYSLTLLRARRASQQGPGTGAPAVPVPPSPPATAARPS